MNKSKFLKKSLAALLAILMVVAVIPLSAAASEESTPTPEPTPIPRDLPNITVNSQAVRFAEGSTDTLEVEVEDTTTVSFGYGDNTRQAWLVLATTTAPGSDEPKKEKLPYESLDLTSEATKNGNVYTLGIEMRNKDDATVVDYTFTLNITVKETTAFNDPTLKIVRVNQSFEGTGSNTYKFDAIKADLGENDIVITLPLGLKASDVGLGTNFGGVVSPAANSDVWSRVFVPKSPNATVNYKAPTTDQRSASVVITARDGKTKTYPITFKYENALTAVSVEDRAVSGSSGHTDKDPTGTVGQGTEVQMDKDGNAVIYVPVSDNYFYNNYAAHTGHYSLYFTKADGTVRVEDPQISNATVGTPAFPTGGNWAAGTAATNSQDEPIASRYNTINFGKVAKDGGAAPTNPTAYLTVITEANWLEESEDNSSSTADNRNTINDVYANLRIELTRKATGGTGVDENDIELHEIQLDGYRAEYTTNPWKDGDEITVYVDNDFVYTNGWDKSKAHRLTVTTNGTRLTVPEQNANAPEEYWQVKTYTDASFEKAGGANHLKKGELNNLNVAGNSFKLQIGDESGNKATFTIRVEKAGTYTRGMSHFNLKDSKGNMYYGVKDATGQADFVVTFPAGKGFDGPVRNVTLTPAGTSINKKLHVTVESGTYPANSAVDNAGNWATSSTWAVTFKITFSADERKALKSAVEAAGIAGNNVDIEAELDGHVVKLYFIDPNSTSGKKVYLGQSSELHNVFGEAGDKEFAINALTGDKSQIGTITVGSTDPAYYSGKVNRGSSVMYAFDKELPAGGVGGQGTANGAGGLKQTLAANSSTGLTFSAEANVVATNTALKDLTVFAETDKGTVTLPGAKGLTQSFGVNGPSNYNEVENSVTTLGKLWTTGYTQNGTGLFNDILVLRVLNAREQPQVYKIRLRTEVTQGGLDDITTTTKADLTVTQATTGLDDELVYGGNTISDISSNSKDGVVGSLNGRDTRVANINDAAYIGTIEDKAIDVEVKALDAGSSVIIMNLPNDYDAGNSQKVYFTNAQLNGDNAYNKGALVRNNGTNYTKVTDTMYLDNYKQDKQGAGVMSFVFDAEEINTVWNGSVLNPDKLSPANVLYAYSQKDKDKATYNFTTNEPTSVQNYEPTHVYYVVGVIKGYNDNTTLSGLRTTSDFIGYSFDQTKKIVTLNVPHSWNWTTYRDTNDFDFRMVFSKPETATLIDALRDPAAAVVRQPVSDNDSINVKPYESRMQETKEWISDETNFFVMNGELYIFNPNTGEQLQVTGNYNYGDKFRNAAHGNFTNGTTELRVYDESKTNIDTWKLVVKVDDAKTDNTINSIKVGETFAKNSVEEPNVYRVALPQDSDLENLMLEITTTSIVNSITVKTVAGEKAYEAKDYLSTTWNLSGSNTITVVAEDGVTTAEYTLVVTKEGVEPTAEPSADPTEEPTAEPSADPSEEPSVEPSATPDIAKNYTDLDKVSSDDMRKEVVTALNLGLMNGTTPTTFAPKLTMKRYQFALVIARADLIAKDKDVTGENVDEKLVEMYPESYNFTFKDVSEKVELPAAAAAVQYCYDKGYVDGTDLAKGLFSPNAPILREQAAKIMVGWAGLDHDDTDLSDIPDGDKVSDWAKGYVKAAYEAEIIKGRANGDFDPRTALKREEGACLMVRTYEKYILNGEESEPTPTPEPTETPEPTSEPTEEPDPTAEPTEEPTAEPTVDPTEEPTAEPTAEPTVDPTEEPTAEPSTEPSTKPAE